MADYQAPPWARAPASGHNWTLVEIKNGTEIAQHDLGSKQCVTLGRAADMVDIELAHESCSRRHARIAFDSRGVPWLRDLGSTHGTTVNKKVLPAAAIGKVESVSTKKGSRGVVLFPGDLLQFGGSTRLFCLEGPPQFERGAIKALEQQQQHAEPPISTQAVHQANVDESEDTKPKTLDDNSIPPQHQKAWEALKARRYKQQNLETESQRIEAKGELSVGQERQLERNRQRLSSLQEDINEMERELMNKIYPGVKGGPKRLFNAAAEEDDVDDRTGDNRRKHTTEAETEGTLVAKWKQDHQEYSTHTSSISKAESRVRALQSKVTAAGDDEDAFFIQNELDLAKDVHKKAKQRREEALADMKDSEKLLKIVNNKIITDLTTGYIGTEIMPPPPTVSKVMPPPSFSMPPPGAKKRPAVPSFSSTHMPPPTESKRAMPPPAFIDTAATEEETPAAKRARVVGPAMAPPIAMVPPIAMAPPIEMAPPMAMAPPIAMAPPMAMAPPKSKPKMPMGTLAFLSANTTEVAAQASTATKVTRKPDLDFDGKKDEWRAPTGQDGSGRTKLNEKFAGRY